MGDHFGELVWTGRAWPAAEIAGREGDDFTFTTTGRGRPLELIGPAAWWRNFSEIDLDDAYAVIGFVRRRGDPFDLVSPTTHGDTAGWQDVLGLLQLAASCWTRNKTEVSVCLGDNNHVIEALLASPIFVKTVAFAPVVGEARKDGGAPGLTMRITPKSLASYMVTSAILHLASKQDMGICQQCADWFEYQRSSQFCSASCRAAASASKKGKR